MSVDAPVKCPACYQHDAVNVLSLRPNGRLTCRQCGAVIDFVTQQLVAMSPGEESPQNATERIGGRIC